MTEYEKIETAIPQRWLSILKGNKLSGNYVVHDDNNEAIAILQNTKKCLITDIEIDTYYWFRSQPSKIKNKRELLSMPKLYK